MVDLRGVSGRLGVKYDSLGYEIGCIAGIIIES